MKKSKKINKNILRFFAFVSVICVTLSAFCIGGNAISIAIPSVDCTNAVNYAKSQHRFIEFRNNSVRYSADIGYCYNTVLLLLPQYFYNKLNFNFYNNSAPQDWISAGTRCMYAGFTSDFYDTSSDINGLIIRYSINQPNTNVSKLFPFSVVALYYNNGSYYADSSLSSLYNSPSQTVQSGMFTYSSIKFNSNSFLQSFVSGPNKPYIDPVGCTYFVENSTIISLTVSFGSVYQYVWDVDEISYEVNDNQSEQTVIDFTNTDCSCSGDNVCDCDCGYYTEQLKEELIDYFDTNFVTKTMFLQYMSSLDSLAQSYSSLANSYSVQAVQQGSLARDFSSLANAYSVLASQNGANNSLLEEQNDILSSRYAEENSRVSEEQSNLDSLASGTTSPDTDISGGVAELSSKFDIYFNQIESFRNNLSTVPVEVSQAGVMVTNITNKLPNSIKVAIIFVLVILVVSKVIGR